VPKFRRATPPNSEVISAPLLHLKLIFDPPLKKVVKGAPVPGGRYASKTWSFSSACKNLGVQHPLGAERWFSKKCAFGGFNSTSRSPRSLDRTSPDLFRLTWEESMSTSNSPILNIFIRSKEIGRQTSKSTEIGPNFACFWPLKIFWGGSPKISARDYKTEHT